LSSKTLETISEAEYLALLPVSEREKILSNYSDSELAILFYDWNTWARPKQLPPKKEWYIWLLKAGRGFGKTRSGAGWVHERAIEQRREIAMIARTPADARDFMIEGPGGILRNTHPELRPLYEPSKRRLTWRSTGSIALIYSDDEPEQLRGFSGDTAWADEFCKFKHPQETWDNLQFGMRETGGTPKICITTTPKPMRILQIIKALPGCIEVIGTSYENKANLHPLWFKEVLARYEGTRLGRQEIYAEELTDNPDALWKRDNLDKNRVTQHPALVRVVVAVDPEAKNNPTSAETGIIVAGIGEDGHGYILDDLSLKSSPDEWAKMAITGYHKHNADRIIGESNNGGDMVEYTIRTIEKNIPFNQVHASRGKYIRAEPISALYEQNKIHHVGTFGDLEDQMCEWTVGDKSPDRLDALVWALTELMLKEDEVFEGTIIYDDPVNISTI
jgi:phage terminase large subunit-like protein